MSDQVELLMVVVLAELAVVFWVLAFAEAGIDHTRAIPRVLDRCWRTCADVVHLGRR